MATSTLPTGWSLLATRSREDLHQALLTSTCERAFRDVPVDCWDEIAGVWRPTSIVRVLGGVWDTGRDVEVLVPEADGTSVRRVGIAGVRLSRLLTAGVSRYWVARYLRLLVLRLIEQAVMTGADLEPLPRVATRLRHRESLGRDVWATAYLAGARDGVVYASELAPTTDEGVWEPAYAGEVPGPIRAAVRMLADDLLRLDHSLEEAGATAEERAAHPLLAQIAAMLLRSPAAPARFSPAESGSHPA